MNIRTLEKKIDSIQAAYQKALEDLAAEVRAEKVIPFCDSRNVEFMSGMGAFWFKDSGKTETPWLRDKYEDESSMRSDKVWQTLFRLLNVEADQRGNSLGEYMEGYTPKTWRP